MLNLTLSVEEINAILTTLGQLPTSSGAYPLMMKIKHQAENQTSPQQEIENIETV